MNQQGGFWNVQRIAAAPKGTIERISLALGTGLTEHLLNQNLSDHPNATIPGAARGAMAIFAKPSPRTRSRTCSATRCTSTATGEPVGPRSRHPRPSWA
jgi:hypothetical protein